MNNNKQEFIVVGSNMLQRLTKLETWQQKAVDYLDELVPDYEEKAKYLLRYQTQLDELKALIEEAYGDAK